MEIGVYTKITLRYVSINNQTSQAVGMNVCEALPAVHAFTGCEYTASFSRKGKIRPLKTTQECENTMCL